MRKLRRYLTLFFFAVTAAAFAQQLSRHGDDRDWHGDILGVPYDFRPPDPKRFIERWWNPDDPRLFTPHFFGVGWSVNLYRARQLVNERRQPPDAGVAQIPD